MKNERLTEKHESESAHVPNYIPKTNTPSKDVYEKLGQIEDLEDELGIDLLTLFKAKEIYWRYKYLDIDEYCDIKKSHRVQIDLNDNCLRVYNEYDDFGFHLSFKDYGKTWALTKEELE